MKTNENLKFTHMKEMQCCCFFTGYWNGKRVGSTVSSHQTIAETRLDTTLRLLFHICNCIYVFIEVSGPRLLVGGFLVIFGPFDDDFLPFQWTFGTFDDFCDFPVIFCIFDEFWHFRWFVAFSVIFGIFSINLLLLLLIIILTCFWECLECAQLHLPGNSTPLPPFTSSSSSFS